MVGSVDGTNARRVIPNDGLLHGFIIFSCSLSRSTVNKLSTDVRVAGSVCSQFSFFFFNFLKFLGYLLPVRHVAPVSNTLCEPNFSTSNGDV